MVKTNNSRFDLSIFRKSTYTGLLLNFNSYCPYGWKIGLLNCLLSRAYRVCTSWNNFHLEIGQLKSLFLKNGYPIGVINMTVSKFLKKVMGSSVRKDAVENVIFLTLPYFGAISDRFRARFNSLGRKYNLNVRLAYRPFKVGYYFSLKSRVSGCMQSGVIYKFVCSRDANEAYIGKTQRHLFARIKEHLNPLKQSAIRDHRLECDCVCTEKNFVVLKQCSNNFELSILESLLIKQHRPTLNQTMTNNGKSIFLQLF